MSVTFCCSLNNPFSVLFSEDAVFVQKTKMPKCMVKGCRNRQRKDPGDFSLHTFPKSPTKIKSWLMATGEHFDNVDDFVQQIMEQKKSNTFRICSDHFCPESFANTPVKRYLKYGAVPTRFPKTKGILNFLKLPQKPSVQKTEVDASMFGNSQAAGDAGPATSHQSTSIEIETDDTSHLNGIHDHDYIENLYYELPQNDVHSVETNTSVITSNKCISTSNYFGRRNASTQTSDLIISRHARTSTADFFKSKDAWTWTGLSEDLEAVTQTPASKKPGREAKKRRSKNYLDDKEPSPSTSEKAIYESSSTSLTTPSSPSIMLMEAPFTPISQMTPPQSCSEVDTYVHEDSMQGDPNCSQDQETTDIGELSFVTQPSPEDIIAEKKFIVFETCLDQLLRVVQRCNFSESCNAPIREREKTITGTLLSIYTICENNHRCLFWQSQPMIGKRSCGNILASASVLFSGSHFSKVNELFKIFGVPFISKSVHCLYQKQLLFPTVTFHHKKDRWEVINALKGNAVCLLGKGQWDRTAMGSKYCTYTLFEESTEKILDCNTLRASGVASSSLAVESKAFRGCLDRVHTDGLKVAMMATDRNVRIKKIMRKRYCNIKHQYDILVYCRDLQSKLKAITKHRMCQDLAPWTTAIVNHMQLSCWLSKGDAQSVQKRWNSVLHHVTNEHVWDTGTQVQRCTHPKISEKEERKRIWLDKNSFAYGQLERIVMDNQLQDDLKNMSEFCHTDSTEVFHRLLSKYRPNEVNFSKEGMTARTKLAVLAHNAIIDRKQTIIQRNYEETRHFDEPRYQPYFSKGVKQKELFEPETIDHIAPMLAHVIRLALGELEVTWTPQGLLMAPIMNSMPRPPTAILTQAYVLCI